MTILPRAVTIGALALLAGASLQSAQQPLPPVVVPMPALLQAYAPITAERLTRPADGDWPMVRRTYDGWGYSPLDQITPANVQRLQPA
jgi:alcohol dehydrogenase (cytochrome c)